MKKTCIFTTYNFQINQELINAHHAVINRLTAGTEIEMMPLRYNLPHKFIKHFQALDYGLVRLVNEYENILTLDVDCIPLSKEALVYTVEQIEKNVLIGTAQRSMHIENDKHVYVGSPCFGMSTELYRALGTPSCAPTARGDTAEELTYLAEELGYTVEKFMPVRYEADPLNGPAWELDTPDLKYGIGTTFADTAGNETFYHLFESRTKVFDQLFIKKCTEIV